MRYGEQAPPAAPQPHTGLCAAGGRWGYGTPSLLGAETPCGEGILVLGCLTLATNDSTIKDHPWRAWCQVLSSNTTYAVEDGDFLDFPLPLSDHIEAETSVICDFDVR